MFPSLESGYHLPVRMEIFTVLISITLLASLRLLLLSDIFVMTTWNATEGGGTYSYLGKVFKTI